MKKVSLKRKISACLIVLITIIAIIVSVYIYIERPFYKGGKPNTVSFVTYIEPQNTEKAIDSDGTIKYSDETNYQISISKNEQNSKHNRESGYDISNYPEEYGYENPQVLTMFEDKGVSAIQYDIYPMYPKKTIYEKAVKLSNGTTEVTIICWVYLGTEKDAIEKGHKALGNLVNSIKIKD